VLQFCDVRVEPARQLEGEQRLVDVHRRVGLRRVAALVA
jgi:hypothetical protein